MMPGTVRKLQRQNRALREELKRVTAESTFFQQEYERLKAENIYLLMENETLKQRWEDLKGKRKKKSYHIKPNTSGKKKKHGRKPGFKGTSRKRPDRTDDIIAVTFVTCPECGTALGDPVVGFLPLPV
jgi:regulator of replication initiation timing